MLYYYYIYRATDFGMQWLKTRVFTQGCAFWGLKKLKLTFNPFLFPEGQILEKKVDLENIWLDTLYNGDWGCSQVNCP